MTQEITNDLNKYVVEKIGQLDNAGKNAVLRFIERAEKVREGAAPGGFAWPYVDMVRVEIIFGKNITTMNGFYGLGLIASVKLEGDEVNLKASIASLLEAMAKNIREREYACNGPCNGDPFERIPVQLLR